MTPYAAIVMGYRRPQGLVETVESLRQQSPAPSTLLVWHNAPSDVKVEGAVNIYAEKNFGCPARHAAALLVDEPVVVFVDDDLTLTSPDLCSRLVTALEANERLGVVGWRGRNVARGERPYSSQTEVPPGPADVVKGLFHATHRMLTAVALGCSGPLPPEVRGEDDIMLCGALSIMGFECRVLDIAPGEIAVRRDEVGNEKRPDHMARRDAAVEAMIALGWRPRSWEGRS